MSALRDRLRRDPYRLGGSFVLAIALWVLVDGRVNVARSLSLPVTEVTPGTVAGEAGLWVEVPALWAIVDAPPQVHLEVLGHRAVVAALGSHPTGRYLFVPPADFRGGQWPVGPRDVIWVNDPRNLLADSSTEPWTFEFWPLTRRIVPLGPGSLELRGDPAPDFQIDLEAIEFGRAELSILGLDRDVWAQDLDARPVMEAVDLSGREFADMRLTLDLAADLRADGLSLEGGPVPVLVPVHPSARLVEVDLLPSLVATGPDAPALLSAWQLQDGARPIGVQLARGGVAHTLLDEGWARRHVRLIADLADLAEGSETYQEIALRLLVDHDALPEGVLLDASNTRPLENRITVVRSPGAESPGGD